jgi:Fe-S cluster biogenesis protein NfuA
VTGLAARVTAALERSVLPSVIARGAAVRVAAVEAGVVTLEVTGSPGAAFPLASRIETAIRASVPEVTGVRLVAPAAGPPPSPTDTGAGGPPSSPDAGTGGSLSPRDAGSGASLSLPDAGGSLADAAQQILDAEVNPAIGAHHGHVSVDGGAGGWIRVRLEGGCQGCSLAEVTLRQGIEPLLRARLPGMTGLIDITDHEAGSEPFFSPEKR